MHVQFEHTLARCCAPTLAGVKPASAFKYNGNPGSLEDLLLEYNDALNAGGVYICPLCECGGSTLLLVYNRELLRAVLDDHAVKHFLLSEGYHFFPDEGGYIGRLKERVCDREGFPHEIGVFLGYPLADVKSFIEKKGRECLVCGSWKVYHNEEDARKQFALYEQYKREFCECVTCGESIIDICKTKFHSIKEKNIS